ncbi:pantoate--beta-alanine ligase [Chlorobaculum sp. MV4-Y]|uniref:pantoate--beta-alanine ligase n=1 Tax=Chlorobaculum sp. MV4-Y TaxID=2976335 RepID=UPI0021AE3F22|nr:pantoate--beta-alanine ligase [Chlorobaculum sp. MV4-Y]UWX58123.1 pantoate--beta-alanine ligase [Chlorobaculum sp. MV4-Y]
MQIINDPAEMQKIAEKLRLQHQYIGVVMTMGALHEGHLSLVKLAKAHAGTVIMTIFVNPTQFGPNEDFHRYPRPFEQDAALARSAGIDYLFAPSVEAMYPDGYSTSIDPGPIATRFEGASRPGHFSGVATVVVKLLGITRPHLAVFGEKDAQQLTVIRRVVADLNIAVTILGAPVTRESDGLATSSRNIYLSSDERQQATVLYRAIQHAKAEIDKGRADLEAIATEADALVRSEPDAAPDYICFVDNATFEPVTQAVPGKACRLVMAVRIGKTRLIDNWRFECP